MAAEEGNKHAERRGGHPGTSGIHRAAPPAGTKDGVDIAVPRQVLPMVRGVLEGEGEDDEPCPKVSGSGNNKKSMAAKSSPYVKPQGEGGYTA